MAAECGGIYFMFLDPPLRSLWIRYCTVSTTQDCSILNRNSSVFKCIGTFAIVYVPLLYQIIKLVQLDKLILQKSCTFINYFLGNNVKFYVIRMRKIYFISGSTSALFSAHAYTIVLHYIKLDRKRDISQFPAHNWTSYSILRLNGGNNG